MFPTGTVSVLPRACMENTSGEWWTDKGWEWTDAGTGSGARPLGEWTTVGVKQTAQGGGLCSLKNPPSTTRGGGQSRVKTMTTKEREASGAVLGGNERQRARIRSVCETRGTRLCSPSQLETGGPPPRWQAASALALDHRAQASARGACPPQPRAHRGRTPRAHLQTLALLDEGTQVGGTGQSPPRACQPSM